MKKLFYFLILFALLNKIAAQSTPCTAICLDPTKNQATGQMPLLEDNDLLLCGSGTAPCDNPLMFVMRASGATLTLNFAASSCKAGGCGIGIQTEVWSGNNCSQLSIIDCAVGTSGTLTFSTQPGNLYYFRACGLCDCQCNITLTYNKNQILGILPKPTLSGPKQICLNSSTTYSASVQKISNSILDYQWSLIPSNAGTLTKNTQAGTCDVKITNPPANGKIKLQCKPIMTGKCLPTIQTEIIDIDVIDLKPATCDVKICPEQKPFAYSLSNCIKTQNPNFNGTPNPDIKLINLANGTKKTETINYTLEENGCVGKVTLNMEVFDVKKQILSPLILCENETQTVKGQSFSCSDASNSLKNIRKTGNAPASCDSTFDILVQCLKIDPKITGVGTLDCSNSQVVLSAATSSTLPNNFSSPIFTGTGNRTYAWSRNGVLLPNMTQSSITVTQSGSYEVTVTYVYEIKQTINGILSTFSKACSKTTSVQINSNANTPVAETPITLQNPVCKDSTTKIFINPDPNATAYMWMVNNATVVSKSENPQGLVEVFVKNNGSPFEVCLIKKACQQISTPNCITVDVQDCGSNLNCQANAGSLQTKFIVTASNVNKTLTVKHNNGTQKLGSNDTYAFVLHQGLNKNIKNILAMNKTGTFSFDSTTMQCKKIYQVSYVVGKNVNGFPDFTDKCTDVCAKSQPVTWLCQIKIASNTQARTKENIEAKELNIETQNIDNQINIFPNPTEGNFIIEHTDLVINDFSMLDSHGQVIVSKNQIITLNEDYDEVNVENLPKGVYVIKMKIGDEIVLRKVIVK